jgi:hypothetical protein
VHAEEPSRISRGHSGELVARVGVLSADVSLSSWAAGAIAERNRRNRPVMPTRNRGHPASARTPGFKCPGDLWPPAARHADPALAGMAGLGPPGAGPPIRGPFRRAAPATGPGNGLEWDDDAVARHQVEL